MRGAGVLHFGRWGLGYQRRQLHPECHLERGSQAGVGGGVHPGVLWPGKPEWTRPKNRHRGVPAPEASLCFSAAGAPSGKPGPAGPALPARLPKLYIFLPRLPEVPLPGPEPSAPADLSHPWAPASLPGFPGQPGFRAEWDREAWGALWVPTQASPTGQAPGGLSVSKPRSLGLTTVSACTLYPINKLK